MKIMTLAFCYQIRSLGYSWTFSVSLQGGVSQFPDVHVLRSIGFFKLFLSVGPSVPGGPAGSPSVPGGPVNKIRPLKNEEASVPFVFCFQTGFPWAG